jgi:hypothetical protein
MGIRLVDSKPFLLAAPKRLTESHRELGENICYELGLDPCSNPETILRLKGFEIEETDDTLVEVIGGIVFCPDVPLRELGLALYRAVARIRLLEAKRSADEAAISEVTDAMVLPRSIAMRCLRTELPRVNLYAPVDYLYYLFVRHHGSGEMPAIGSS